ncbi:hypothetical protein ASPZODRAFT_149376 [Penicilliopsis zonata CBS 506.65]|uniref:C2H2-type domain-containing protein n=1 Tax=Penicilliopsis zonata CBS 506.65 TaxID=1073090 RepID=A0A1L9SRW5_9EURO|nr:hypothetical protein ASPZODRAFT_149376 [Penicilliopsis zonata CBS 506.65]OJJ49918.1 hypothetical protein ASPZODRAFT_149376 [Penicilliopsis zonata CBS 506.65]
MGDGTDYPSPRSEDTGGPTTILVPPPSRNILPTSPKMTDQMASGFVDAARPRLSLRRARDPPKNATGQIFCDHADCQPSPPTFRRPCEWNKHMDKHDRPYKCMEPGCDKVQGFTYSGGLLRHQREVHKKNVSAKKPLMCPYADCNRSTGHGFTRQENLKEHLRRRHMHSENGASPELPVVPTAELEILTSSSSLPRPAPPLKRKRDSTDETSNGSILDEEEAGVDLRSEVKRLRNEVKEKDRRLEELEKTVAGLQQALSQPTPAA